MPALPPRPPPPPGPFAGGGHAATPRRHTTTSATFIMRARLPREASFEPERGDAICAVDADRAAMRERDRAHDREAQAAAAVGVPRRVEAIPPLRARGGRERGAI